MTNSTSSWAALLPIVIIVLSPPIASKAAEPSEDLLAGQPRFSYEAVEDIAAMEAALRESLAGQTRYSFSRGWWQWDRLRCRYVDDGRRDRNSLEILRAVFRSLILDRHAVLQARGEGDLLYLFFTTLRGGKREEVLEIDDRQMLRDVHGGGTHGGWGGAARMRIYEELVKQEMLTPEEKKRFREIVHQSFERRFIDFRTGYQHANNHAFGNVGGIAIALRLFPNVPQAVEAKAWTDRIWKEWTDISGTAWRSTLRIRSSSGRPSRSFWAAEQIVLGGRPPNGSVSPEYTAAYNRRFAWFNQRDIKPRIPTGRSAVGYLSPLKQKIPERLYVCPGRASGKPFASFFVYDDRGSHLNPPEVWGTLYEYCVDGAKLLGSAGKYTDDIPGGSGAYDSLMVTKPGLQFPIDADGSVRSGRLARDALRAENRGEGSFGQYAFSDYFGEGSRWTRQTVLTQEGYLVVRDVYQSGEVTDGYQVGPCWQCKGEGELASHPPNRNWFDAPAWDYAWWQNQTKRLLVCMHDAEGQSYHVARHPTSADISRSIPTDGFAAAATVKAGEPKVFLTVLVPHDDTENAEVVVARIKTHKDGSGNCLTAIGNVTVSIQADGTWSSARSLE